MTNHEQPQPLSLKDLPLGGLEEAIAREEDVSNLFDFIISDKCQGEMKKQAVDRLLELDESCGYEGSFNLKQDLLKRNPEYRVAIQEEIKGLEVEKLNVSTDYDCGYQSNAPSPRARDIYGLLYSLQNSKSSGLSREEFELRQYYFRLKSLVSGESPPSFKYIEEVEEVDYSQKLYDDWCEARGPVPRGLTAYDWYGPYDDWGTRKG